jgi:5,10-methylene-tetrahydrofolate dehydrogenase/methenyl tetrahydrofolate cyclohydrolase
MENEKDKAALIDGKGIAAVIRGEIKEEVAQLQAQYGDGKVPGLAVVLVGSRKDSQTYVRNKKKCCDEVGIVSYGTDMPEEATEEQVLEVVAKYNADPLVHGILVQLPLPKHINEEKILTAISIEKDVDGFHPENIGKLAMRGRNPYFVPCTPKGSMELLERMDIPIEGKSAVVVGRSNIVGTPAAMLLQRRNATVTVVHSRTPNPEHYIKNADIVVAACGIPNFVQGSWLKPGAAVIDVGINAVDDPTAKRGYRLVGDVDFAAASQVAGAITPVPGGVGPMTIAMLLKNTLEGAKYTFNKEQQA